MRHPFLKMARNYQHNLLYLLITQPFILFGYVILYFNEILQKNLKIAKEIWTEKKTTKELEENLNSDFEIFWDIFRKDYNKCWVRSVEGQSKFVCKTERKLRLFNFLNKILKKF